MASIDDVRASASRADALVSGVLGRLLRQKRSQRTAMDYVRALGRDVRANCWDLAEKAGHEGWHRMQALLGRYRWSWEDGREMLPALAQEALGREPDDGTGPGLAVDETTDLKDGDSTACVSPQHSGVTGGVENCVTWVFSALVTATGQAWAWFDLYMPKCWAGDANRRKKAGIPESLRFATKPELAIAQVRKLKELGIRFFWVAADEVYGRSKDFRDACRDLGLSYVAIIPCSYMVTLAAGTAAVRADGALACAVFEHRSAGNGTKGSRQAQWALLATADPEEFLLIRKLDRDKNQYTFYLCHAAPGWPPSLAYFVSVAGKRWPVESSFKSGKDALGWDQSQARTWKAQNRHTLLTALAQIRIIALRTFLTSGNSTGDTAPAPEPEQATATATATATEEDSFTTGDLRIHPGADTIPAVPGLPCPVNIPPVRLSDTETARIDALIRACDEGRLAAGRLAFHLRWSQRRRHHQAVARWHHYATRLASAVRTAGPRVLAALRAPAERG
jgi:SRSO17 transposase